MDNEIIKCVMVPSRAAFIPGNKRELGGDCLLLLIR